jgi:hypothetical protein
MSSMRDLIGQLESMNETLDKANFVRDAAHDAVDRASPAVSRTHALSTSHIAQVQTVAEQNGWRLDELNDVFCQAKFERDGNEIEWHWSDASGNQKANNKFVVNIWTSTDGVATIRNARVEHLDGIFGDSERWRDDYDCRQELSASEL